MTREHLTKDQLREIARELINTLKEKNLIIWQAKEVLKFAGEELEWEKLK